MKEAHKDALKLDSAANAERRKRLGQYFTGIGLGRLLASLSQAEQASSIIDPMAGSGDLLASCLDVGASPELLAGIEIDEVAYSACVSRLPKAHTLLGSAFSPDTISRLQIKAWDLVIANPPYVRYQSFSEKSEATQSLPSAMQIRTDLLKAIQILPSLDVEDKRLFTNLVEGYSGLSDLAVPSWILCAGLVKHGGRLALVVPESWLTRDYATIVHYMLFRWFDIEFVVEDEHAAWFEDAQVKTTLIVAKRVKRRETVLSQSEGGSYCHIVISAAAANLDSPIGKIDYQGRNIERHFALEARGWLCNASPQSTELVRARPVYLKHGCKNIVASASRQKWFAAMGEKPIARTEGVYIPHLIHEWLSRQFTLPAFETFESQGVAIGQGLRTGANGFFYADGELNGSTVRLSFSGPLIGLIAEASLDIARPVLRRQSELPAGFVVSPEITTGWVLDLRQHALPEDRGVDELASTLYKKMPTALAEVVRAAEGSNFGTASKPLKVWELTAVAPNIKPATRGQPAKYWYMLPSFAPRHQPDVILARVNSTTPTAYLNKGRACLIDANFSAMWTLPITKWSASGLLAFMNSAWSQAVIECSGAVMGGGALKVEATHLRRFPVPPFSDSQLRKLEELGELLASTGVERSEEKIMQIDAIVAKALNSDDSSTSMLREIARAGQAQRAKHKGR
ncbi:N-6 DNA methylase [Pseudomonas sp. PONIH3]|uniref:N-6 DNA methylase n=1 Tax=Pseudomonas sp. PONIH3 TaxID=1636610 RepID=UPI003D2C8802